MSNLLLKGEDIVIVTESYIKGIFIGLKGKILESYIKYNIPREKDLKVVFNIEYRKRSEKCVFDITENGLCLSNKDNEPFCFKVEIAKDLTDNEMRTLSMLYY